MPPACRDAGHPWRAPRQGSHRFDVTAPSNEPEAGRPWPALALAVDRHDDGHYFWVVLESFDRSETYERLFESSTGFATYVAALQAGSAALAVLAAQRG